MHFSNTALLAVIGCASGIAAHGIVEHIKVGDQSMDGYKPHAWTKLPTAGWEIPKDQDHGYLNPNKYQDPDIICHVGATPGKLSLNVAPGDSIALQWTSWPVSHHGNEVNYLANCHGECQNVDKTKLKFNKIDEKGLIHPNTKIPIGKQIDGDTTGYWAGDELIANDNLAWFKVPEWLADGSYVLRHELQALHNAMPTGSGIQHIPQCINLIVTGGGSDSLESGTLGTDLYRADQPGVVVNIFANPGEYTVPGPPVYVSGKGNATPAKPSAVLENTATAPAKTSGASVQQTSAAPMGDYSVAPLGDYSVAPSGDYSVAPSGDYSVAPEKTPVPQATSARVGYQNSTMTSTLPQETTSVGVTESNTQSPHGNAGMEASKSHPVSGPKKSEVPGKSSDYDYDLSNDANSGDGNTGGYTDTIPKGSSPDKNSYDTPKGSSPNTNSYIASDVKAGPSSDIATDASSDLTIANILDLIEQTLKQLREKLVGKNARKRHARDLTL